MAPQQLDIARTKSSELVVQALPDGSMAVFDVATRNVYSLNPSAAAAWEGCASGTTLSRLAGDMSKRLSAPVTEDLAHEAVSELAAAGLVSVSPAERLGPSRRELLKQVAGVAIPVVLVLTGAEQRAHAQGAGSEPQPTTTFPPPTTTPGPTTPPPGTTEPPVEFEFVKWLLGNPSIGLPGVEFDVKKGGQLIAHVTTGAGGFATIFLPPGTYTLVETDAPGGLDQYTGPFEHTVQVTGPKTIRNFMNVLKS